MDQDRLDIECEGNRILADVRIDGNLRSEKSIWLEGVVVGSVQSAKRIVVQEKGVIDGDVECEELYIRGKITGNVCVACKTVMGAGAVIQGALVTACLEITPGAVIGTGLKFKSASK